MTYGIKELAEKLYNEQKGTFQAVNWNENRDGFTQVFWRQFTKQFWLDTEVGIGKDKKQWDLMTPAEKQVFKQNFISLTMFDTYQSEKGMASIKDAIEDSVRKATLGFAETMEAIHAKSYSTIFTTLMEKFEIDELFEWGRNNKYIQYKIALIVHYYNKAKDSKRDLYMALVASVYLESFLFYSGFYYPLYLAGRGRMMATADMVNLIIRDEAIHGVYVGMIAQELFNEFTYEEKQSVLAEAHELLEVLMSNETVYTHETYGPLGGEIVSEVIEFIKYNANKALQNLGFDPIYKGVTINPIIENGLDTDTKMHDFFSTKGNGYIKANIEQLEDEDFNW